MDDGYDGTFRVCLEDKTGDATLAVDPEKVRPVWNRELRLKIHPPIWTDPEEVNARFPGTFKVGNGRFKFLTDLFVRA